MKQHTLALVVARSAPVLACIALALALAALIACSSAFVPSGTPGCARGHRWSDSAARCIAVDSLRGRS